jgi:hypothetical protein
VTIESKCPNCGDVAPREPYDIGSGPELSCASCEWCWGANGQDLLPLVGTLNLHGEALCSGCWRFVPIGPDGKLVDHPLHQERYPGHTSKPCDGRRLPEVKGARVSRGLRDCPNCKQGEHAICIGEVLGPDAPPGTLNFIPCPCAERGHTGIALVPVGDDV